jgi:Spy/CpxP family protein refolding chaperone
MKLPIAACVLALFPVAVHVSAVTPASPYIGQEARDIKALSAEEVNAYLSGKGMGLAKAAELNGYPGPAHVLELAAQLSLTPAQRARSEALFAAMASKAVSLGRALIDEERRLDQLFATKSVTADGLSRSLDAIAALQAKVRGAHLEAHLVQAEILTPEQSAGYARLRGYGSGNAHMDPGSQHKH